MYTWIWRHLPGPVPVKLVGALALAVAVAALLWFVIFPWIEPRLPLSGATVSAPAGDGRVVALLAG